MTFQRRLRAIMKGGNLRVADLAEWLDRRYTTVREWVTVGRVPRDAAEMAWIEVRLEQLERSIAKNAKPTAMRPAQFRKIVLESARRL